MRAAPRTGVRAPIQGAGEAIRRDYQSIATAFVML
jgi:hypothetical protein